MFLRRLVLPSCIAVLASVGLTVTRAAHAQTTPGFALNRFDPSERGSEWFALDTLDFRGTLRPAIGIVGDYAYRPLVVTDSNGNVKDAIVNDEFVVHLGASFVLWERLRLGLDVPLQLYADGTSTTIGATTYAAPSSAVSFGDIRLGADVRLVGEYQSPFSLALGLNLYLPTGSQGSYAGDGGVRVTPHALVAGELGPFVYGAKLGIDINSNSQEFAGSPVGTELQYGVSAGIRVADKRLVIGPEIFGGTVVAGGSTSGAFKSKSTPVDGILGFHYTFAETFRVGGGVGLGLTEGYGSPEARGVASLEWVPGVTVKDRDNDGILDVDDACPDIPGVHTDDPKTNGCPADRDHDGVPDAQDACPDVPGIHTEDPKTNGCPDPDRDKDGIPNETDACPDEPGPPNVDPAKNGCPKAVIRGTQIKIIDQVRFKTASTEILPGPDSEGILQAVLEILKSHPEIKHVQIEGHTDNRGSNALNDKLSAGRAKSVLGWLTGHGIEGSRLSSIGYGSHRPIAENTTDKGRAANRRVDFQIETDAK